MKHLSRAIIAVFMAILMGTLFPVQVFADTPEYVSEVKVFEGSYDKAADEGYTILTGDDGKAIDLNQGSGSTEIGSKGNKKGLPWLQNHEEKQRSDYRPRFNEYARRL